jgi:hypothetical protein
VSLDAGSRGLSLVSHPAALPPRPARRLGAGLPPHGGGTRAARRRDVTVSMNAAEPSSVVSLPCPEQAIGGAGETPWVLHAEARSHAINLPGLSRPGRDIGMSPFLPPVEFVRVNALLKIRILLRDVVRRQGIEISCRAAAHLNQKPALTDGSRLLTPTAFAPALMGNSNFLVITNSFVHRTAQHSKLSIWRPQGRTHSTPQQCPRRRRN